MILSAARVVAVLGVSMEKSPQLPNLIYLEPRNTVNAARGAV